MADITAQFEKDLNIAVAAGLVSARRHPFGPFTIYNYTKRCAWERAWTPATLAARGLILDDNGTIVARPFTKFFNLSELSDEQVLALGDVVSVMEKMDGSLGIAFNGTDGPEIATRGSFTSEQALHATQVLRRKYPRWRPENGRTVLFEIVYPENRIVTDYGTADDLYLLAVVDNASGLDVDLSKAAWPGPRAMEFRNWNSRPQPLRTVLEWLETFTGPDTMDSEGYVLRFTSGERVKIKHENYVRMHRLMTGVTARKVWEELAAGRDLDAWTSGVPEEFEDWIRTTASTLRAAQQREVLTAEGFFKIVQPYSNVRRDFADAVKTFIPRDVHAAMFALLDGRSIEEWAWKRVKPEHDTPFKAEDEAAN